MNVFHRKYSIDDLTHDLRILTMGYVTNVTGQRAVKKRIQLLKGSENQTVESKFPADSKRYVHDFSSVKLEASSLGLKFCDTYNRSNHINKDIQSYNL